MKLAAAGLLALMAALMWHSASGESQTYDEAVHLVSGYSYWTTGDFRMNPEHPPLSKLWQAVPLMAMRPSPPDSDAWKQREPLEAGRLFVHHNSVPASAILMSGRMMTMLCAIALGAALFWWTRWSAGPLAAGVALGLYALDPNFIAHGHYITSDVPVALAMFLSAVTWWRYLETGSRRHLAFAALALAAALATKFSALFLLPVHLIVGLIYRRGWQMAKRYLAVAGFAVTGLAICYGPATARAFLVNPRKPLATLRDNHPYAMGVKTLVAHNNFQQPAYLLGEKYKGGK
jgi:4-amino-4-deoxy-L-arabinose transferase-like glycosyltransferase